MGKTISCANCGGCYDDELPKCPYCGSGNIKGAEKDIVAKRRKMNIPLDTLN